MIDQLLSGSAGRVFVALAIGLLIGAERERRKGDGPERGAEGLRTFALVALLGGLTAQTAMPALIAAGALFVGAAAVVSYWFSARRDPGITTEVALVVAYALGVLAQSQPVLAVASSVVVTVLLAWRGPLHHFVRDTITEQELHDGLLFTVAALVVLPLMPDRAIDPYGLVNPFSIWRLVVVLMALTASGHIALRAFGLRYGLTLAGFCSGFISSAATVVTMGARTRSDPQATAAAAAGGVGSMLGSLLALIALVGAMNPAVVYELLWPFSVSVVLLGAYALWLAWWARQTALELPVQGRAFDPKVAIVFAGMLAAFAIAATLMTQWLGPAGAVASSLATGLVDAQAAAVSMSAMIAAGKLNAAIAPLMILIAMSANMLEKIVLSFATGTRAFGIRVSAGVAFLVGGLWLGQGITVWIATLR